MRNGQRNVDDNLVQSDDDEPERQNSPITLADFVHGHALPNAVRVLEGHYRNIGADADSEIYVHSSCVQTAVVAEALLYDAKGRASRLVTSGRAFSLPLDYRGWFELMSEDGRTASAIRTVRELVERFPASCLVRQTITAMSVVKADNRRGQLLEMSRTIHVGEVLRLVKVALLTIASGDGVARQRRLLHCLDGTGHGVLLALDQRGLFSPIADQSNIGTVYSVRSVLTTFRLPVVVRLIYGSLPDNAGCSAGIFRLVGVRSEEMTFVLPLRHAWQSSSGELITDRSLVAIPTVAADALTVMPAARDFNQRWLLSDDGLELSRRCEKLVAVSCGSVRPLPSSAARLAAVDNTWTRGPVRSALPSRQSSLDSATGTNWHHELFEEIDDIYHRVRHGGQLQPAQRARSKSYDSAGKPVQLGFQTPNYRVAERTRNHPTPPQDVPASTDRRPLTYGSQRSKDAKSPNHITAMTATARGRRSHHCLGRDVKDPHYESVHEVLSRQRSAPRQRSNDSGTGSAFGADGNKVDGLSEEDSNGSKTKRDVTDAGDGSKYVTLLLASTPPPADVDDVAVHNIQRTFPLSRRKPDAEMSAPVVRRRRASDEERLERNSPTDGPVERETPPALPCRPKSSVDLTALRTTEPEMAEVGQSPSSGNQPSNYRRSPAQPSTSASGGTFGRFSRSMANALRRVRKRTTSEPSLIWEQRLDNGGAPGEGTEVVIERALEPAKADDVVKAGAENGKRNGEDAEAIRRRKKDASKSLFISQDKNDPVRRSMFAGGRRRRAKSPGKLDKTTDAIVIDTYCGGNYKSIGAF